MLNLRPYMLKGRPYLYLKPKALQFLRIITVRFQCTDIMQRNISKRRIEKASLSLER